MGRKLIELNTMISEASEAEKQNVEEIKAILDSIGEIDEDVIKLIKLVEESCAIGGGDLAESGEKGFNYTVMTKEKLDD